MISEYSVKDIDEINNLGSKLNPNFTKLFHVDNLNKGEMIYVYKDNNKVVAFIHISINYEVVDLLNIIVDSEYRNKNIATLLMDYMIGLLPIDTKKILLEVNKNNERAIRLYNKFNFKVINIRKKYYNGEDALIMERIL